MIHFFQLVVNICGKYLPLMGKVCEPQADEINSTSFPVINRDDSVSLSQFALSIP